MSEEDKIKKEHKAYQQDLENFEDTGTDDGQGEPSINIGMDARKAIYARQKADRKQEVEAQQGDPELMAIKERNEGEGDPEPDPDYVRRLEAEAAGLDQDPSEEEESAEELTQDSNVAEERNPDDLVTIVVDGEQMLVPQRDVDAAGGLKAYQIEVASYKRFREASELKRAADEQIAKLEAQKAEIEKLRQAEKDGLPPDRDARSEYVDAKSIVDGLYASDTATAEERINSLNDAFRRLDEKIESLKAVEQKQPAPEIRQKEPQVRTPQSLHQTEVAAVNAAMAPYQSLIDESEETRARVYSIFVAKLADPSNRSRLARDVAVEAAEHVLAEMSKRRSADPLGSRREQKKTLSPQRARSVKPSVAEAPQGQDQRKSGSDVVAELRKRRGQRM